jgi:hypothetical protein
LNPTDRVQKSFPRLKSIAASASAFGTAMPLQKGVSGIEECATPHKVRDPSAAVAAAVALVITAGYWWTASTSFPNPAITIARAMSDTFAGVRPGDAPGFIVG